MNSVNQLGQFIPLHYHYQMLLDSARMEGFKRAIDAVVKEGDTVLELGAGTGVLSFYAAQKAKEVFAVEMNPSMVDAARRILAGNKNGERVTVIEGDASVFVPDKKVDVVICEMLHSAMLREKQISVIEAFKRNYFEVHNSLPVFIPDTTFLAAQPVEENFEFHGYKAPIPLFQQPTVPGERTRELATPYIYSSFEYRKPLPRHFVCTQEFEIADDGVVNAVRFITKNILAVVLSENSTVDWHNFYLVLPLSEPLTVRKGEKIKVSFSYPAEGEIAELQNSLNVVSVG